LRLAPNLQVARVNTGGYAISSRGFNNAIGNKLLVLIDGRTVYTPQYSGVNWDSQFVMLEDVERIEVISGPGATLWGANAVNGVINVISRASQATQGALVSVGGGNRESGVSARYGGKLGASGSYRIYGTSFDRDNTQLANGSAVVDGWRNAQAGFRADWTQGDSISTLQGDTYQGKTDPGPLGRATVYGTNLLGRWTGPLANGSGLNVQAYFARTERDDPLSYRDTIDLFDAEFQNSLAPGSGHKLLWGGGYRYATDDTQTHFNPLNFLPQVFMPARRVLRWGNLFVQDEVELDPDLKLTLGLKAESNVYTGVEYLPSARLAWTPGEDQLFWGALSRAVRAPARLDRDFYLSLQLPNIPLIPLIQGGPDFQSETAYVAELGYRAQPTKELSYSATAFYSYYDKLRSGMPPPAVVQNGMYGPTYGLEAWGTFQASPAWRLSLGLVALREDLKVRSGSLDPTGPSALGNDPKFQWTLRSSHNLASTVDLDFFVRHVGELPDPAVPAYTALGARIGWRPNRDLELSLTVQDALDGRHVEFGTANAASELDRSVFLKVQWRL
jgi:iron complex outermembrane receptor protein